MNDLYLMKWRSIFISLLMTVLLIFVFNIKWGKIPPLGKIFSPQVGFWQNAEKVSKDFSEDLSIAGVKQPVKVWLDKEMVPHIFAKNDADAYYVQGYLTARDRLWQMEMQIRATGGYVSEVLGKQSLEYDRRQRRKGMVSAAKKTLAAMESDSTTREMVEAYTQGINAYIQTLDYKDYPLEYKLLNYQPERWTPLKTALLIKYLGDYLTGNTSDLKNTNALKHFSLSDFNELFPVFPDSLYPIIPKGTAYYNPTATLKKAPVDSLWIPQKGIRFSPPMPDKDNGSNNWAVQAKRTASGSAILANDPHLTLNMPSLWYEVQIHSPNMNVYGASLPGAPGVVIGFNNRISWGVTNAMRDVKDFYAIKFKDSIRRRKYWYKGEWKNTKLKVEKIKIRHHKPFYDTVAYTVFGPVMYDPTFPNESEGSLSLAVHWAANDTTNELKAINLINHANNYNDFKAGLKYFENPGQNFAFADVTGNVGVWEQGKFPVRWKNQGKFILPGFDDTYRWKKTIPFKENPHIFDPEQGYVFSANQNPTDSTYPYPYFGHFIYYRAQHIDQFLKSHDQVTIKDMMRLQTDYYSAFAAEALPFMLSNIMTNQFQGEAGRYMDSLKHWQYEMNPKSMSATIFHLWWKNFKKAIWYSPLHFADSLPLPEPTAKTTIEWLKRNPNMKYLDNKETGERETLQSVLHDSFTQTTDSLAALSSDSLREWGVFQGTNVMHLTGISAFSHKHLFRGGGRFTVNANKNSKDGKSIGPSWRMVVQMSTPIKAYGIYPGGQSGNPGSRYYDNFIEKWNEGEYFRLNFYSTEDSTDKSIKYRINFTKNK